MRPSTLALCVSLVLMTASAASAQAVKPLLQLRTSVTYYVHGTQYADQYLFVATDGTATGQLVTGDPVSEAGWLLSSKTARASVAQLKVLQDALGRARIGVQPGGCSILPRFSSTGSAELTWYGRGLRKNALAFTISGDGENPCPPELQALFQAIDDFSAAVLGQ
ncbi:MAG TPA: hypothetical protein VGP73_07670 [Thermoanaerobaculia bacterium]